METFTIRPSMAVRLWLSLDIVFVVVASAMVCAPPAQTLAGSWVVGLAPPLAILGWGLWRVVRVVVRCNSDGLMVRNVWRSFSVPWSDVAGFDLGTLDGRGPKVYRLRTRHDWGRSWKLSVVDPALVATARFQTASLAAVEAELMRRHRVRFSTRTSRR